MFSSFTINPSGGVISGKTSFIRLVTVTCVKLLFIFNAIKSTALSAYKTSFLIAISLHPGITIKQTGFGFEGL